MGFLALFSVLFFGFFLSSCKHSYQRETITERIREIAKKEYKLDVDVKDLQDTIGVRFDVKGFLSELFAADQLVWKQIDDLILLLSRVALSCDRPPTFMVLDIRDPDNPNTHLIFTRHTRDVKKLMSEGISRTQFLDRLLIEFAIGKTLTPFDPQEMDFVRLLMMASEGIDEKLSSDSYTLKSVVLEDFLAKVGSNMIRRIVREGKSFQLREVVGSHEVLLKEPFFRFVLDLVPLKEEKDAVDFLRKKTFPDLFKQIKEMLWSYQFKNYTAVQFVEKNLSVMSRFGTPAK